MDCLHIDHNPAEPLDFTYTLQDCNKVIEVVRENCWNGDSYAVYPNSSARTEDDMGIALTLDDRHFTCFIVAKQQQGYALVKGVQQP